ncbi:hypothetical protein [Chryseobacterium geocarposphaerae]|nr:hypothetical protein [Chryseobacterium geocarposphaerae]
MLKFHRKTVANPNQEWIAAKMIINNILEMTITKKSKNLPALTIAAQLV